MQIKTTHPKIWLSPEKLAFLRANQGRLEWKRLLTNCEDGLHRDEVGVPPTYDSALNYALVYRVTGSTRHADFAIKLVELYLSMGVQDAMTKVGATGAH